MVTMSQKSSVLQAARFVSRALTPDSASNDDDPPGFWIAHAPLRAKEESAWTQVGRT
jgi:hypothetical protein